MLAEYASYSMMRAQRNGPALVDWRGSLDLTRFWQSCLDSLRAFRPYASCSLFFDFEGFQPLCAKHHVLRHQKYEDAPPGTGLVVGGPYLKSHPQQRIATYTQIAQEDPEARQRRLQQEPDPDWEDFVQMAFWHEGRVEAVLNVRWAADHRRLGESEITTLQQLYPLIESGLSSLLDLEMERARNAIMQRSMSVASAPIILVGEDGGLLHCSAEAHRHCLNWNRGLQPHMPHRLFLPDGLGELLDEALQGVRNHLREEQEGTLARIAHPAIPGLSLRVDLKWHEHGIRRRPLFVISFDSKTVPDCARDFGPGMQLQAGAHDLLQRLTPRERVVALMVAEGMGNDEIARRLARSRRTIESQLISVFRKLDVRSRLQLLRVLQ